MSGFLARQANRLLYISLMGPPRAVRLHAREQGTGGELDQRPVGVAVLSEYVLRAGLLLLLAWGLQEAVGHLAFRRYRLPLALGAWFAAGSLHTLAYYLSYGGVFAQGRPQRLARGYRLGRNTAYALFPALACAGLALLWQSQEQIPLFRGHLVQYSFALAWAVAALLGAVQALWVQRVPSGLEVESHRDQSSR